MEPCAAYDLVEHWTDAQLDPFADCPEGPNAVKLMPGESRQAPFTVAASYPAGYYAVNGSYRVGCEPDLPLEEAGCDEGVLTVGADMVGVADE